MVLGKYGNGCAKYNTRCPQKESSGALLWQIVGPGGSSQRELCEGRGGHGRAVGT